MEHRSWPFTPILLWLSRYDASSVASRRHRSQTMEPDKSAKPGLGAGHNSGKAIQIRRRNPRNNRELQTAIGLRRASLSVFLNHDVEVSGVGSIKSECVRFQVARKNFALSSRASAA